MITTMNIIKINFICYNYHYTQQRNIKWQNNIENYEMVDTDKYSFYFITKSL